MVDLSKKRFRFRIVIPAYPAFNIYSRVARGTTALGPVCVASSVNEMEKWDAEVIDENNLRRHGPGSASGGADHELLQTLRPVDAVGLYGGLTSTIPRLYKVARFYKEKDITTIAGGQHFVEETIPEALNSHIDYVVTGEGEETIRELLQVLEGKRDRSTVKGIVYREGGKIVYTPKREQITDFDRLPLPDFSLVRYAKIDFYPVDRIRGCGMDCEFCTVKGKPRSASPERLLEQISYLLETTGTTHFFVVDDLFGQQRDETIRFCNMLRDYQKNIGRSMDVGVQIRLDKAKDTELLSAMRKANIGTVAIGLESPIEEELKAMNKRVRPEEMLAFIKVYHSFGFLVHGMFIFGYPLEEGVSFTMPVKERIRRFRSFIKKAGLDTIQVMLPVPLPGTELRRRLERQKRIYPIEDVGWEYYDGNFPLFEPDAPMGAEELQASVKGIMGAFYHFRCMFMIGFNVFAFPTLIFFLHNIQFGWRRWYRSWRSDLLRFGGWITMKAWIEQFKKSPFSQKLVRAKEHVRLNRSQ